MAFGKVDTEAERELAGGVEIISIPALVAFRERAIVFADSMLSSQPVVSIGADLVAVEIAVMVAAG